MSLAVRQIRTIVETIPGLQPVLTEKQRRTREIILTAAVAVFARLGFGNFTLKDLSEGCRVSRYLIRFHFPDMESLLGEILNTYLARLEGELIGPTKYDRRTLWFSLTRTAEGKFTPEFSILVRQRRYLPPDIYDDLIIHYNDLLFRLDEWECGPIGKLFEQQSLTLPEIEKLIADRAADTTFKFVPEPRPRQAHARPAPLIPFRRANRPPRTVASLLAPLDELLASPGLCAAPSG